MNKKSIFLSTLLTLVFLIALYLIVTSKKIDNGQLSNEIKPGIDISILINNYKKEAIKIIEKYLDLLENNLITEKEALVFKSSFLELKVPKSYKETHLKIILTFEKVESYFNTNNDEDRLSSIASLIRAKNQLKEKK